jgi:hypothetical protein
VCVHAAGDVFHRLAHHQGRHIGRLFHHLDAAPDITLGIRHRLAGLLRDQLAELVVVFLEQMLVAQHQTRPLRRRHLAPFLERGLCRGNGAVDLVLGGRRRLPDHLLAGGVGDINPVLAGALLERAFQQQGHFAGHAVSPDSCRRTL